jgi:arylsulfatase A-like enzyme
MPGHQPHILLITADELRKDALSCYGARAFETPHLDALARTGTRFENAYTASPLCLPSRCAILTGLYPHRSGAYSNFRPCPLNPQLPNLYNRLRSAGYTTAHVGKCHYSPAPYDRTRPDATIDRENVKEFYLSLGLDHLDLQNGKMNSVWFWNDYSRELDAAGCLAEYRRLAADKLGNGRVFPFPGPDEWHPDAWVGRKAVEYIEADAGGGPQFLWVSFSGPHYPFDAPESYTSRVDMEKVGLGVFKEGEWDDPRKIQSPAYLGGGEKMTLAEGKNAAPGFACRNFSDDYWRRLRRAYFANVVLIDDWIGRILARARASWGDDLLVLFTSDHGDMLGNHRLWGKNSCTYEDILRVPLIVRFPGGARPGRSDARVVLTDILPTCLGAAGVEPPEVDGRDLALSVEDGGCRYIFSEAEGLATVSDGRFKYVHCTQRGGLLAEAYDLERDPFEFENVIDDPRCAADVSRLRSELVGFFMKDLLS